MTPSVQIITHTFRLLHFQTFYWEVFNQALKVVWKCQRQYGETKRDINESQSSSHKSYHHHQPDYALCRAKASPIICQSTCSCAFCCHVIPTNVLISSAIRTFCLLFVCLPSLGIQSVTPAVLILPMRYGPSPCAFVLFDFNYHILNLHLFSDPLCSFAVFLRLHLSF